MTDGPLVTNIDYCTAPDVHGDRCRCRLTLPEQRGADFPGVHCRFSNYHSDGCRCSEGTDNVFGPNSAVDMVNHPPHYTSHPSGVECIDITRHLTFTVGNAFKYVFRALGKGNAQQDYDKARFYLADALRHADPIFLPSFTFRTSQLLNRVVEAETTHNRQRFFRAITPGNIAEAHAAAIALRDAA